MLLKMIVLAIENFQFIIDKDFQMRYDASFQFKMLQICQIFKVWDLNKSDILDSKFTFAKLVKSRLQLFQILNIESSQIHTFLPLAQLWGRAVGWKIALLYTLGIQPT